MRIALVVHAFPPASQTGVETYCEALARALGALGHELHVFAPRREEDQAYLCQTREPREAYCVTWLAMNRDPDDPALRRARPGVAQAFGRFLDRERPEVVHFQHIIKLGYELIDEARERGLVTVFTAHDPFAICNDYCLLAADLSELDPGDLEAQARNERARGVLDRALPAHDGFLSPLGEQASLREAVAAELQAESSPGERDADLARRVARLRIERDTRLAAISRCDRVEAPTTWLADLLAGAGLHAAIVRRSCGHDIASLRGLPAVPARHEGPLRVLYLGGLYEHKGAHVLLAAAAELGDEAEVNLRGCAGSSHYAQDLAQLATEVGAELGGPFDRAELPALLQEADVLVLPSLWPENAPFVIREAFAAGRPVIASDTPALRESVRNGVDGRLFPVGDSQALATCLRELARDRAELVELCAGVRAPKGIEQDALELGEIYRELAEPHREQAKRRTARQPAHLANFASSFERLNRLPTGALVAQALEGLERLAQHLGEPPPNLASALAGAGRLRERVADLSRAASWREQVASDREHAMQTLEAQLAELRATSHAETERARWREDLLQEREERLAWTESKLEDRQAALTALEARSSELAHSVESLKAESDWLRSDAQEARNELSWTRECLEDRADHLSEAERAHADISAALSAALEEHAASRAALEACKAELGAQVQAHAELGRGFEALHEAHAALQAHETWLRGELRRALAPLVEDEEQGDTLDDPDTIVPFVSNALERLHCLSDELNWRVEEMNAAGSDVRGIGERLFNGPLIRRVASWREPGDPATGASE